MLCIVPEAAVPCSISERCASLPTRSIGAIGRSAFIRAAILPTASCSAARGARSAASNHAVDPIARS